MAGPVPTDHSDIDIWGAKMNAHLSGHAVPADGSLVLVKAGAGSPETNVAAPIGTIYLRNDGGSGTTLYVKESGSGNTGWVAKGATANAPAGGVATKLIAASDAPSAVKARADIVCDGTADQIDINAFMGTQGRYVLSEGNFSLSDKIGPPTVDGITLEGSGWYATTLNRVANKTMIDASGVNSATHRWTFNLKNMRLNGGGSAFSLPMVISYYGGPGQLFENLKFYSGGGAGLEFVESWDINLNNLWFSDLGQTLATNSEALRILSTKEGTTTGNFGFSVDSSNNIRVSNVLFFSNRMGDISIAKNGGSNNPHRNYLSKCKFENQNVRNGVPAMKLEGITYCTFRDFNFHPIAFDSGQTVPIDTIDATSTSFSLFDHILLENNSPISRTLFKHSGNAANQFSDIITAGSQIPTVAGMEWNGTNNNNVFNGLQYCSHSGAPTKPQGYSGYIQIKAGAPLDADYTYTPRDGMMVLDTTNHRLYVRDGGVWKYTALT